MYAPSLEVSLRMRQFLILFLIMLSGVAGAQATPADQALLDKTRALYDTPLRRGLISFDCAVNFDFRQHVLDNFGSTPPGAAPLVEKLQPLQYRAFVDIKGAVISNQQKLPDLTGIPNATTVEDSNRSLMQSGLSNWIPYAAGEVLPLGPTKYHFTKILEGYELSMTGQGLDSILSLNSGLKITSMSVQKPMEIDATTEFSSGPDGLVLSAASTNANHTGNVRYKYTYQPVDGFRLPSSVTLTSPQNLTLKFDLTDCKTQHGTVEQVKPSTTN
jgi:hypothetical protein